MAALRNRAGHYIFVLWFLSFFPRLFSAVAYWMSTILPHMMWPCAHLECTSEMCCTWLAENRGCKISPKIHYLGTIAQLCRAVSSQLGRVTQQYLLHMSPQYGELPATNGWDRFLSLWQPSKFQQVSYLGIVMAPTLLNRGHPNFAWCLAVSWAGTLCIHFQGLLPLT